jgi:PilZ domain
MADVPIRRGRVRVHIPVVVTLGQGSFRAETDDVSLDGLFLVTDRPVQIATRLSLEFTLPHHVHPTSMDAEVRWVRETDGRPSAAHAEVLSPTERGLRERRHGSGSIGSVRFIGLGSTKEKPACGRPRIDRRG